MSTAGGALYCGPLLRTPSIPAASAPSTKPRVVVVGAGAFGGWTALYLLRRGAQVTLVDAWGPGNSRASSGGETRVIRGTYGPDQPYTKMVVRALQLWRENENRWGRQLFYRTGVLWMTQKDDSFEKGSVPVLRDAGLTFETLKPDDLAKRFPQINLEGITWAIYEPDAGYLRARYACETVLKAFLDEGGKYRTASAKPGRMEGERLRSVILSDGSELQADQYVFACGPWLGKLFPDVIGDQLEPTRQEIFFFGIPAGDTSYSDEHMPTWVDHGERYWYGIAGNQWRGFKVADDTRGPRVDPTHLERVATPQALRAAREYMEFRFPGLKGAPLLESRVCQYENTPKHDFIVDRHPSARNLLLLGGGSGHGFKHGPALGEYAADVLLGNKAPEPLFQLSRLKGT